MKDRKTGMSEANDPLKEDELSWMNPTDGARPDTQTFFVPIQKIIPNPNQPRKNFSNLDELIDSIKEKGVLEPLLVRECKDGFFILAGERRYRAAQAAGITELPCRVLNVSEEEAIEIALIENIQREDLTQIEEARAYQTYIEKTGIKQADLAKKLGVARSTISRALKLLTLPKEIQDQIEEGKITGRLLRELLLVKDKEQWGQLLELIEAGEGKSEEIKLLSRDNKSRVDKKLLSRDNKSKVEEIFPDTYKEFFSLMAYDIEYKGEAETLSFLSEKGKECLKKVILEWKAKR